MVFLVTIGLGKTNGVEKPELKTPPPQEVKPVETPVVNVPPPPPVVVYNPMARKVAPVHLGTLSINSSLVFVWCGG